MSELRASQHESQRQLSAATHGQQAAQIQVINIIYYHTFITLICMYKYSIICVPLLSQYVLYNILMTCMCMYLCYRPSCCRCSWRRSRASSQIASSWRAPTKRYVYTCFYIPLLLYEREYIFHSSHRVPSHSLYKRFILILYTHYIHYTPTDHRLSEQGAQ